MALARHTKKTTPILFPLFLAFVLGVLGGWYVGQKKASFLAQNPAFLLPSSVKPTLSENEPNDSPDTATLLQWDTVTQGSLSTGKDVDFFKFNVDVPANIHIVLTKLPQEYQLYVYNPSKQLIAASQRHGFLDSSATLVAATKGTYYIKIFTSYSGTASLPYTITISPLPLTQ